MSAKPEDVNSNVPKDISSRKITIPKTGALVPYKCKLVGHDLTIEPAFFTASVSDDFNFLIGTGNDLFAKSWENNVVFSGTLIDDTQYMKRELTGEIQVVLDMEKTQLENEEFQKAMRQINQKFATSNNTIKEKIHKNEDDSINLEFF
jgi:hypothetical protein